MKINNHYIPQTYLKYWAIKGKVFEYNLFVSHPNVPNWNKRSLRSASSIPNLYHYSSNGEITDNLEEFFGVIESNYNNFIKKIEKKQSLSQDDQIYIAQLLSSFYVRTLGGYERISELYKNNGENILNTGITKALIKTQSKNNVKRPIKQISKDVDLPIKVRISDFNSDFSILKVEKILGKSVWVFAIKKIVADTSKVLEDLSWTIYESPEHYYWPTSDDPVIFLNYDSNYKYNFKGGWGVDNVNVIFPLTPKYLLFSKRGLDKTGYYRLSVKKFILLEKMIIEHACLKIYSKDKRRRITKIRKRVIDKEKRQEIDNQIEAIHKKFINLEMKYTES